MAYHAFGFVDGAYLRALALQAHGPWVDPRALVDSVVQSPSVQSWCALPRVLLNVALARVIYYDARPNEASDVPQDLREYWEAVELLPDTELGFGSTRGGTRRRPPRQKGVDTLIAVDMLTGAFHHIFSVAVLVAGDADFVPVVNEVRRAGVMVVVAAEDRSVADDLRRAADRFVSIDPDPRAAKFFPPLEVNNRWWTPSPH